jgi:hypothetical protein
LAPEQKAARRAHHDDDDGISAGKMIGLLGEALTEEIRLDAKELEDARWFGADELEAMHHGVHAQGLRFPVPMAIAHHLVLAALARRNAAPPCGENK